MNDGLLPDIAAVGDDRGVLIILPHNLSYPLAGAWVLKVHTHNPTLRLLPHFLGKLYLWCPANKNYQHCSKSFMYNIMEHKQVHKW